MLVGNLLLGIMGFFFYNFCESDYLVLEKILGQIEKLFGEYLF